MISYDSVRYKQEVEAIKTILALRKKLGIDFKGKRVMDIGCEIGCKSRAMKECGADVYVVEPNKEALEGAYIANDHKYNCFAQDLPSKLYGTFDLVTMFLYRVLPPDITLDNIDKVSGEAINKLQLEVTKVLAKLIKPDGEVIIEMSNYPDDYYLYGFNENVAPLMWQLKQVFEEVFYEASSGDSIFIRARKPFSYEIIDAVKGEDVVASSLPLNKEEIYYPVDSCEEAAVFKC